MASDAHSHPFDLSKLYAGAEAERVKLNLVCAASAWRQEEFLYNENAARAFPMALCFAVHPQLPSQLASHGASGEGGCALKTVRDSLSLLSELAAGGRIDAVGETGFDLFNGEFRATEELQDELFRTHLVVAEGRDLPLVLHVRHAMQKIFSYSSLLKNIPSVVFHSYSGTAEEAASILRRGVNAYFSFGTAILLNHKNAIRACAAIDSERLLFETDAPYQRLPGRNFSTYADIHLVIEQAALIKREAGQSCTKTELERTADENFYKVYRKMPL
ncbi:MAG: TatD family hydrolase [Spirochaetaceae bacterium]|jgi:TatD DNase family protein|nr:TatD family hydrolase [Spirochaetaceae bacterium]